MRYIISAAALLLLAACGGDGGSSTTSSSGSTDSGSSGGAVTQTTQESAEQQEQIAALPAPYNEANYASGMEHFRECRACHTIAENGGNRAGPNLYGVIGRAAGAAPNFNYSAHMRASGITWDAATLDRWITKPNDVVPGTYMAFRGFQDPTVRRDVIAYIMVESAKEHEEAGEH